MRCGGEVGGMMTTASTLLALRISAAKKPRRVVQMRPQADGTLHVRIELQIAVMRERGRCDDVLHRFDHRFMRIGAQQRLNHCFIFFRPERACSVDHLAAGFHCLKGAVPATDLALLS